MESTEKIISSTLTDEEKITAEKEIKYKLDFTEWIYNELRLGKKSVITYLPFVPALGTTAYGYLKEYLVGSPKLNISYYALFHGSILIQVVIIFCILVYQIYFFSITETNGLSKKIRDLLQKKEDGKIDKLPEVLLRFTHTESKKNAEDDWKSFQHDFDAACKNILYFKISWIVLWVNWFCYYIALYFDSGSAALFDFFMVTETLCFAACYYRLTYHVFESKNAELQQYWWSIIMLALLFALAIADQSFQNSFAPLMVTSALKTIFGCTFLGLLVGTLTQSVQNSPNWLKILLFVYVALQAILFGIHEMPSVTKQHFQQTIINAAERQHQNSYLKMDSLNALTETQNLLLSASVKDTARKVLKTKDSITITETVAHSRTKNDSVRDSVIVKKLSIEPPSKKQESIGDATLVLNDSVKIIQKMEIVMFNLCLALKYLLMFYFIWLLRYDHLMVYFMRTQGDEEYVEKSRKEFDGEIEKLTTKETNPNPS